MPVTTTARLGRGLIAAAAATALFIGGAATPASATDTAKKTIDTYTPWGGVTYLQDFGNPDTSTYGQVVTIPNRAKRLKNFTFWMGASTHTSRGTITMRGELYGWDGTKATTPVWESKPRDLFVDPDGPLFEPVKFKAKKAKVKPGEQYVIFASVSKDYEVTDPFVTAAWGTNLVDVLPGTYTVFINDTGDESKWTSTAWTIAADYDFAMIAKFK
jgi:hypothetical protein